MTFLPELEAITGRHPLTTLQKAELLENTLGTVIKLLFAFLWQEAVIDLDASTASTRSPPSTRPGPPSCPSSTCSPTT